MPRHKNVLKSAAKPQQYFNFRETFRHLDEKENVRKIPSNYFELEQSFPGGIIRHFFFVFIVFHFKTQKLVSNCFILEEIKIKYWKHIVSCTGTKFSKFSSIYIYIYEVFIQNSIYSALWRASTILLRYRQRRRRRLSGAETPDPRNIYNVTNSRTRDRFIPRARFVLPAPQPIHIYKRFSPFHYEHQDFLIRLFHCKTTRWFWLTEPRKPR